MITFDRFTIPNPAGFPVVSNSADDFHPVAFGRIPKERTPEESESAIESRHLLDEKTTPDRRAESDRGQPAKSEIAIPENLPRTVDRPIEKRLEDRAAPPRNGEIIQTEIDPIERQRRQIPRPAKGVDRLDENRRPAPPGDESQEEFDLRGSPDHRKKDPVRSGGDRSFDFDARLRARAIDPAPDFGALDAGARDKIRLGPGPDVRVPSLLTFGLSDHLPVDDERVDPRTKVATNLFRIISKKHQPDGPFASSDRHTALAQAINDEPKGSSKRARRLVSTELVAAMSSLIQRGGRRSIPPGPPRPSRRLNQTAGNARN